MSSRRPAPFNPHPGRETYKDLLIFEERLKQNAERSAPPSQSQGSPNSRARPKQIAEAASQV